MRTLWSAIASPLATGLDTAELADLPVSTEKAVRGLLDRLRRADLLVSSPATEKGPLTVVGPSVAHATTTALAAGMRDAELIVSAHNAATTGALTVRCPEIPELVITRADDGILVTAGIGDGSETLHDTDVTAADLPVLIALVVELVRREPPIRVGEAVLIRAGECAPVGSARVSNPLHDLPQRPLAIRVLSGHYGSGSTGTAATADAMRAAARAAVCAGGIEPGWTAAAGQDWVDTIADGLGRLAVRYRDREHRAPSRPVTGWAAHWATALAARDHPAGLYLGHCPLWPELVLVTAVDEWHDRSTWGYGADQEAAAEHALRGLLHGIQLGARDCEVPVGHLPATAPAMLDAIHPTWQGVPPADRAGAVGLHWCSAEAAEGGLIAGLVRPA